MQSLYLAEILRHSIIFLLLIVIVMVGSRKYDVVRGDLEVVRYNDSRVVMLPTPYFLTLPRYCSENS